MPDTPYSGPTTLKRKDTGEIVNLTGEGYWDPNAFTLVSGGTTPTTPVPRYASAESYEEWQAGQPTVSEPEQESIRESERRYIQSQIDLIEAQYAKKITGEEEAGTERYGRTRAILSAGGLLGTPMGGTAKEKTREYTREQIGLLEEEKVTKVNILLDTADKRALERIEAKKLELKGDWQSYQNYLIGKKTEARQNFLAIAGSGVSFDKFKEFTDAEGKDYYTEALEQTGWDPFVFEAMYNLSLPKEQQIDWQYKFYTTPDGKSKVWMFGLDPTTNKPVTKDYELEFEVPKELETLGMKPTFAPDGTLFLFPEKYDPNKSLEEQIVIYGEKGQFAKPEKPTEPTETDAIEMVSTYLDSVVGGDGKVSPDDWNKAKKAWTADGLTPAKFIQQFYMYINPSHVKDYGQKEADYLKSGGGVSIIIKPE